MAAGSGSGPAEALQAWLSIGPQIARAIEGLPEQALAHRGGPDGFSIRETVHHLVEANLVAATIMIAALGRSGCTYDWSWLFPDVAWAGRAGYTNAPVEPALDTLAALGRHVSGLITASPDGYEREVRLVDAPGAEPYTRTVQEVLSQEVEHARGHLASLAETRAKHGLA
jgi:hypothetical protein